MIRHVCMIIAVAICGCRANQEPPHQRTESANEPVTAQEGTPNVNQAASPQRSQPSSAQTLVSRAEAKRRALDYARQSPGKSPYQLPHLIDETIPENLDHKLIGFELHRGLKWVKPAPGRRFFKVRLLTLERGDSLRTKMGETLMRTGWLRPSQALASPCVHPTKGQLNWTIREAAFRPTTIEISIEATVDNASSQARLEPVALLRRPPGWFSDFRIPGDSPFEYSWGHGIMPGGVFSDIERLSVHVHSTNPASTDSDLYALAQKNGYQTDADNPRMLRGPKRMTLFARKLADNSGLVVHHHRRWGRGLRAPQRRALSSE